MARTAGPVPAAWPGGPGGPEALALRPPGSGSLSPGLTVTVSEAAARGSDAVWWRPESESFAAGLGESRLRVSGGVRLSESH